MNLIDRAKNMVLTPKSEWQVIDPEPTTAGELYRGYIMPLSLIGPVAQFIGISIIGVSLPFVANYRLPLVWGISQAIVGYLLGLVGVYIISLIINGFAPSFGGQKNPLQALKVAAYAFTPAWIASVLHILPLLGILVLLASLYSLYVLYLGLPVLMKSAPDKAAVYTLVVVVCAFVIMLVIGLIGGAVGTMGIGAGGLASGLAPTTVVGSADGPAAAALASIANSPQLNQMSAQMEAASKQMESAQKSGDAQAQVAAAANAFAAIAGGGVEVDPVDQNILKGMLPDTLGGLPRTGFEASKSGIGGLQVSKAEAHYGNGQGSTADLVITDMGGAKMLGVLAAWASVEQDKETDTGYEKMGKVDGRPVHETFNKSGSQGEYDVLVAGRFLVEASGSKVDMDVLKKSVAAVDIAKLESMKNDGVKKPN